MHQCFGIGAHVAEIQEMVLARSGLQAEPQVFGSFGSRHIGSCAKRRWPYQQKRNVTLKKKLRKRLKTPTLPPWPSTSHPDPWVENAPLLKKIRNPGCGVFAQNGQTWPNRSFRTKHFCPCNVITWNIGNLESLQMKTPLWFSPLKIKFISRLLVKAAWSKRVVRKILLLGCFSLFEFSTDSNLKPGEQKTSKKTISPLNLKLCQILNVNKMPILFVGASR